MRWLNGTRSKTIALLGACFLWVSMVAGVSPGLAATTVLDVMIRPNPGDEHVYDALKQAFERQHPDITVNYIKTSSADYHQKFTVMYAGGAAPDVLFPSTSNAVIYAMQNMLLPLDDLVRQTKLDLTQYFKPILDQYRVDGKLYALPNDFAALAYVYNAEQFAAQGVARPGIDWTWDEFVALTRKLTRDTDGNGKIDVFGTVWPYTNPWIWSATGTGFFDDERRPQRFLLNRPEAYKAVEFLRDLRWQHHVTPQPGEAADFFKGTGAMSTIGHWTIPVILKQVEFDWGLLSLPRDKYSVQRSDGSGWAIARSSQKVAAAWEFVRFAGGYEGQLLLAREHFITPAHRKVAAAPEWHRIPGRPGVTKDPFVHGLEYAFNNYAVVHPRGSELTRLIDGALNKVYSNQETARVALEGITPAIERILAEIKAER